MSNQATTTSVRDHLTKNSSDKIYVHITNPSSVKNWNRVAYLITEAKDSTISYDSELNKFTAKQFEHFCAYLLIKMEDWRIQYIDIDHNHHADGGVDIVMKRSHDERLFVQCKKHDSPTIKKIGLKGGKEFKIVQVADIQYFINRMQEKVITSLYPNTSNLHPVKKTYLYITLGTFSPEVYSHFENQPNVRKWQLSSIKKLEMVKQMAEEYKKSEPYMFIDTEQEQNPEPVVSEHLIHSQTVSNTHPKKELPSVSNQSPYLALFTQKLPVIFASLCAFTLVSFLFLPVINYANAFVLATLFFVGTHSLVKKNEQLQHIIISVLVAYILFLTILLLRNI